MNKPRRIPDGVCKDCGKQLYTVEAPGTQDEGWSCDLCPACYAEGGREIERQEALARLARKIDGRGSRCADCGERGERTGHMECQYPGGNER